MSYQPFYISSFENESGLDQSRESFIIPEKAFPELEDAFAWRGRVRRRDGFQLLGRLRRQVVALGQAATNGTANYVNGDLLASIRVAQPNAEIQPFTVVITIARGAGDVSVYNDVGGGSLVYVSGTYTGSGTINYITGALSIAFTVAPAAGKTVDATLFYYPALPVMGLPTYETNTINQEQLFAFDTIYAYRYTGTNFEELPSTPSVTWSGTDSDFFWSVNWWRNANTDYLFWTTNFNVSDPIRYWDTTTWTTFNPILRADSAVTPSRLVQCRILLPYKDYFVALNTIESNTAGTNITFQNRARWSQNGDPTTIGAVGGGPAWVTVGAWADDVVGRGGFTDAYTNEAIISAEFIKDVLIVKFERSSWKLLFTGNPNDPFIWQKINTELGAESTFSLVPFDRGVFSVGNVGVMTDDSINVERIDFRIPYTVFNINNDNNGVKRVYGIRDFANELVYWSYPNSNENPTFPNKILVYNYINQTWAIFNDSFTAFGYFQRSGDLTWATLPFSTWASWDKQWNSGIIQSGYPNIVGGNQQGFVEILAQQVSNDVSLAIVSFTTAAPPTAVQVVIPNHNLQSGQFIKITGIVGSGSPNPDTLNNIVYKITVIDADTVTLEYLNAGVLTTQSLDTGGTYIGGGRVSVLNNINITTKRFSPFYDQGSQVRLGYVDFFFDKTNSGEVTVNLFIDESDNIIVNDPSLSNDGLLGDNTVLTRQESTDLPYQANQQKIWHRMYTYAIGQNFQLQISFDDLQMFDESINSSSVVLHAMVLYLSPNARLIQ